MPPSPSPRGPESSAKIPTSEKEFCQRCAAFIGDYQADLLCNTPSLSRFINRLEALTDEACRMADLPNPSKECCEFIGLILRCLTICKKDLSSGEYNRLAKKHTELEKRFLALQQRQAVRSVL